LNEECVQQRQPARVTTFPRLVVAVYSLRRSNLAYRITFEKVPSFQGILLLSDILCIHTADTCRFRIRLHHGNYVHQVK